MKHEVTHHTLWKLVGSEEKWKAGFKVYQAPVGLARTHIRATQLWTTQHLNGLLTPPPFRSASPLRLIRPCWDSHLSAGACTRCDSPLVCPSFLLPSPLPTSSPPHPSPLISQTPPAQRRSTGRQGEPAAEVGGSLAAIHYHETQRGGKTSSGRHCPP